MSNIINLPVATTSDCVKDNIEWLKEQLELVPFGRVGLSFRLHQGMVVGISQIKDITKKAEYDIDD